VCTVVSLCEKVALSAAEISLTINCTFTITFSLSASHRGCPGSIPDQVMWGLWWTKWHWSKVFSVYFGFPCQFSFHRLLHIRHLSSGAVTIRQLVADVPSGFSSPHPKKLPAFFAERWDVVISNLLSWSGSSVSNIDPETGATEFLCSFRWYLQSSDRIVY
jgi:hypothetical protein